MHSQSVATRLIARLDDLMRSNHQTRSQFNDAVVHPADGLPGKVQSIEHILAQRSASPRKLEAPRTLFDQIPSQMINMLLRNSGFEAFVATNIDGNICRG